MSQLLQAAKAKRAAIGAAIAAGVPLAHEQAMPLPMKRARLRVIEQLRKDCNITREAICGEAGISLRWYEAIQRDPNRATRSTITRLAGALKSCRQKAVDDARAQLVLEAAFGGFLCVAAEELGLEIEFVRTTSPHGNRGVRASQQERAAHRARAIAIYLVNQVVGVHQARIARLVGVSKTALVYSIREIEDKRDEDHAFDELIARCARKVTGREE